jgi:protein-tyrosine phosphatase
MLVVCTGNVCRSPYIERLLSARLAGTGIEVSSAGTDALAGSRMDPQVEKRLIRAGGDANGFVARQLTSKLVRRADLVLCATRSHRSTVVRAEPKGLRYTHNLADFSDLAAMMLTGRLEHLGEGRSDPSPVAQVAIAAGLHRDKVQTREIGEADIVDPFRRHGYLFDLMAEQVEGLLPSIVSVLQVATALAGRSKSS